MRVKVSLNGSGGELDNHIAIVRGSDEARSNKIKDAIHRLIDNTIINPGDTITIEEVD